MILQASQNDLGLSLYAVLSTYYLVTILEFKLKSNGKSTKYVNLTPEISIKIIVNYQTRELQSIY